MTISQIEAVEHLDFDAEFPCESRWSEGEEAEWLVTMVCCGNNKMLCDGHKRKTQRYNVIQDTNCLKCNALHRRGEGLRFTPLDKRR